MLEYVNPLETFVFDHTGDMYQVKTQGVDLCTTMNHRMWIKKRNNKVYSNDQVLQNIRNGDKNSANKLRAAFIKNKLWNQGSFINIFFLEDGSNVPRTSLENFKNFFIKL